MCRRTAASWAVAARRLQRSSAWPVMLLVRARLTETLRARPSPTRHALAPLHVCPNHSQGWRTVLRWLVHQCYVREGRFALLVQLLHLLRATRRAGAGG